MCTFLLFVFWRVWLSYGYSAKAFQPTRVFLDVQTFKCFSSKNWNLLLPDELHVCIVCLTLMMAFYMVWLQYTQNMIIGFNHEMAWNRDIFSLDISEQCGCSTHEQTQTGHKKTMPHCLVRSCFRHKDKWFMKQAGIENASGHLAIVTTTWYTPDNLP